MPKRPPRPYTAGIFWRRLPAPGKALLLLAIFFTFATVGVIQDITSATRLRPWPAVVVQAIFGGLAAIGYAYASMRRLWLLPLVFLFQIGGAIEVSRLVQSFWAGGVRAAVVSLEAIEARMMADGIAVILLIALGYTFFIVTIVREGGGFARLKAGGAGG